MFGINREKKQKIMLSYYREVFNSENGKKVLHDMMKTFSVMDSTFDPDPHIHAFNEGARSVVVRLLKTINTDPEALEKAIKGKLEEDYEI